METTLRQGVTISANDVMATGGEHSAFGQSEIGRAPSLAAELPLSAAQSGIWRAIKAGTPANAFIIADYTRIHGAVDRAKVETALNQIVAEIEALRLRFMERDGLVRQVVGDPPERRLTYLDFTGNADPMPAAEAWMRADVARPMNLDRGPLSRAALLKTGAEEFLLYFRSHHLVVDGYSGMLITRRAAEIYSALSEGSKVDIEQLGSFRALMDEDVAYRGSASFGSDREFWLDMLKDCPEPPRPTPRAAPISEHALHRTVDVSPETIARLRKFAGRTQLTIPQVITLAAVVLIHRMTDVEDLVLGQFMSARMSRVARDTPAMMSNIAPLRFSVRPDMPIAALAEQVRLTTRSVLRRQRYRIADIQHDLCRVDRPIVRQIVSVRPLEDVEFASAATTNCPVANGPVEDFNIFVVYDESGPGAWRIKFDANPALYNADELQRLLNRYSRILSALADPGELVGRLDMLPPEERRLVLETWNQTRVDYPRDSRVNELFEAQARRTPDRAAVRFEHSRLTYRQLDEQSASLARRLSALGVKANDRVALHVERSLDMVVALLGVLKAGACYVPLDPAYPRDRLEFILGDCRPRVLVTQRKLPFQPQARDAATLFLDDAPPPDAPQPAAASSPGELAYVIYTSGSTGQPKGVRIPHRALVNLLCSMRREPGIAADDRVLAVTSLSFDIAALELFLPLITGAELILAAADVTCDGHRLAALMASSGATVMQATPATWRMLLAAGWKGSAGLKILCGGEAWPVELADALLPRCSALWNMYGPTETTVWSAAARIMPRQSVLIGPPIANTTLYVLDLNGQPVPLGVPGELCIGGDGLALGYLNRPELDLERFVKNPFSATPGTRLYRTGDRVRQTPDGRFEFLGRFDNQVKVRGFRIEPGEIEAILRLHPLVQDAVVVALDDDGERRLAAFVTPDGDGNVPIDDLRELLRRKAAPYMTPAAIVTLRSFPLTPAGKIDRKALALLEGVRPEPGGDIAPRTRAEEDLAGIWCEFLNLKQVGVRDNFFDLGGDSLTAARVVTKINAMFRTRLSGGALFLAPTIEALASAIEENLRADSAGARVHPLRSGRIGPPIYLLGNGAAEHRLAEMMGDGHAVFAVDMPIAQEWIDAARARKLKALPTLEQLGERFGRVVRAHAGSTPCVLAGYSFFGNVAFETAHALLAAGGEVAYVLIIDAYAAHVFYGGWRNFAKGAVKAIGESGRVGAALSTTTRLARWLLSRKTQYFVSNENSRVLISNPRPPRGSAVRQVNWEEWIEDEWMRTLAPIILDAINPRALDAKGVLIRTKVPGEETLPDQYLSNCWRNFFAKGLDVIEVPGDHVSMVRDASNRLEVAHAMTRALERYGVPQMRIAQT